MSKDKETKGSKKGRPVFIEAPAGKAEGVGVASEVEITGPALAAAEQMSRSLHSADPATQWSNPEESEEYWASLISDVPDEDYIDYSVYDHEDPVDTAFSNPDETKELSSADHVLAKLRVIAAGQNGAPVEDATLFFSQLRNNSKVLSRLADAKQPIWEALLELLEIDSANRNASRVDLNYVPLADSYDDRVQAELALIADLAKQGDLPDPESTWFALIEYVQRTLARKTTEDYRVALDKKEPAEKLSKIYRKIEPPTTKRDLSSRGPLSTARVVIEQSRANKALAPITRISFGLPTLDRALTNPTSKDPVGSIGLGEQMVIAGPTGTGKTSMFYTILPSVVQDLVNLGKRDARVIALHTEETSEDKLRGAGFTEGQRNHHLIDNLVIENIGSSRKRIVEVVYDVVIDAIEKSHKTGRPVTDFAPYVFLLDYLQEINEPGENEVTSTLATAQLIKNGIQEFDPEELFKYSGVNFSTYAGMPWPEELRAHRVAVITFAQLRKLEDSELYYHAGSKKLPLADFAIEDTRPGIEEHIFDPADGFPICKALVATSDEESTERVVCGKARQVHPNWIGPDGIKYYWQVREGDLRILRQNQIRGHGMILQAATTIVFLHRSQPRNNPAITKPNGRRGLTDTRARLILDKTRTGSSLTYVPLAFDLTVDGHRARFYDEIAQLGLERGLIQVDTSVYSVYGDPMIPSRAKVSPLAGVKY